MSPSSATTDIHHEVDPKIWRACAGASVKIPSLYSRVYYFPQGHIEHCLSSSVISSLPSSTPPIQCRISSVELLADPITDEVFAYLVLKPISPEHFKFDSDSDSDSDVENEKKNKVVTFSKVLTPSDANNGGGFSVPRYCADSVFPPLDFQADPPVQKLFITDIRGSVWDFRHIYRGTPRRHLLTTGWSKFVNGKKLIAGDSVVFMRKSIDEMFIGVRRAPSSSYEYSGDDDDGGEKKGFRRIGKGKLTAEAVRKAIRRAVKGEQFEVVYYPTAGWSEFVVRAEDVEASMAILWSPGIRVKMAMETEDSSRITWFQGIVSSTYQETGPWRGSPWKQLQITWDEPEMMQNVKGVNPWQVEVVNQTQLHATYPQVMRLNYPNTAGYLSREEGEIHYSQEGLYSSVTAPEPNPYMFSYTTFPPAGMQGARHYDFMSSFNPTNTGFIGENNFFSQLPGVGKVTTETNWSPSDNWSPPPYSNSTNQSPGSAKANSIQLFGKIINVQELSESGSYDSKESSDTEVPYEKNLFA